MMHRLRSEQVDSEDAEGGEDVDGEAPLARPWGLKGTLITHTRQAAHWASHLICITWTVRLVELLEPGSDMRMRQSGVNGGGGCLNRAYLEAGIRVFIWAKHGETLK